MGEVGEGGGGRRMESGMLGERGLGVRRMVIEKPRYKHIKIYNA